MAGSDDVPQDGGSKVLVVCCDGTWQRPNQAGGPTNVAKVAFALADTDREGREQRLYYQEGIGTTRGDRLQGGIFGAGLSRNVRDCYRFLVQNYAPGDRIYLFGFSRGAYTARSLAGLVRNSGILRADRDAEVASAFRLYRDRKKDPDSREAELFRRTYSHKVARVYFIGVWDTVGALGIPIDAVRIFALINRRWQFHDVQLSSTVRYAYQALAIDERRRPFRPTVWVPSPKPPEDRDEQTLEQVWFSGTHSDAGGGERQPALADIALCWMVEKAMDTGLAFKDDWFLALSPAEGEDPTPSEDLQRKRARAERVYPDPRGPCHDSMSWLYRLLGDGRREIPYIDLTVVPPGLRGEGEARLAQLSNQTASASAVGRIEDRELNYDASNLLAYLKADPARGPTEVPTIAGVPEGDPVIPRGPAPR